MYAKQVEQLDESEALVLDRLHATITETFRFVFPCRPLS
jgi:hypothetical protein